MPAINSITPEKLACLIGLSHGPAIVDDCTDQEFASDPRLVPRRDRRNARLGVPHPEGGASEGVGMSTIAGDTVAPTVRPRR